MHGPRWRLVLIGAGQLTRYLAEMAHMLDYHVVVIDPREEYAAGWDLAGVPLDRGMPDDVVRELNLDGHSAVVALTHDPKLDDLALMEALKSAAFYVGAIGSKKNNDARRERLKEFDVSADEIARLRGPVGLYIGSKTPPEIAVAILAEMTAVRHGVSEPSWAAKPERRFDPSACEVKTPSLNIVGLLLAAGSATRFGSDKLRHRLPHGVPIAVQAARHLHAESRTYSPWCSLAAGDLIPALEKEGCRIVVCEQRGRRHGREPRLRGARRGQGRRLPRRARRHAVRAPALDRRGARRARRRARALAAPYLRARRGHPVGIAGHFFRAAARARAATRAPRRCCAENEKRLVKIPVGDPGVLRDIDTPDDLAPPLNV